MIRWRETIVARSTAFRLAAAMAVAFAVSLAIAFVVAQSLVARDLEARARVQVAEDAAGLARIHERGGEGALIAQLRLREAAPGDAALYAYLKDGENGGTHALLGQAFTGWRRISAEDGPDGRDDRLGEHYLALGTALGDGTLIVARSTDTVEEVREIFAGAMLWGLGITLVLTVAGSAVVARRTERRIGQIGEALDAVASGELDRRVPRSRATADDLDRVSGAINAMLDRLAQNIASLRQVSADIAHDLKTPVQHLGASLEALQREGKMTPRAASIVDEAIGQADRLVQTFQALLRIAQIEGGSPRARFQPTDLAELTQAIADAFLPAVEEAGHRFSVQIEEGDALVTLGDRDLLAQMLSNLLTNAIRHTSRGSDISLSVGAEGGDAVLTVSDTGPGIPEDERERVFRRLYRLERSRTTEGSGVGLAMVAAVVDLHGGRTGLEDNAPGLRAVVRLPLLRGGASSGRRGVPSAAC